MWAWFTRHRAKALTESDERILLTYVRGLPNLKAEFEIYKRQQVLRERWIDQKLVDLMTLLDRLGRKASDIGTELQGQASEMGIKVQLMERRFVVLEQMNEHMTRLLEELRRVQVFPPEPPQSQK